MKASGLPVVLVLVGFSALPVAAQQGIHVLKATYGLPNGPSCDATASLRERCDGKEGCQVYVDPRYLCPDPAPRKEKSVAVLYGCNGQTQTLSFPDGAQLALRCSIPQGGGRTIGGVAPPPAPPVPAVFGETAWRMDGDGLWIFHSNGTAQAENGYWTGTWRREGNGMVFSYRVGSTGAGDTFSIAFSADGRSMTASKNGQVVHRGQRVR